MTTPLAPRPGPDANNTPDNFIPDTSTGDTNTVEDTGVDAAPQIEATLTKKTNASAFELPNGVAYRNGKVYMDYAPTGQIVTVNPATGAITPYAQLPSVPNASLALGMIFDAAGNLYVTLGMNAPAGASVRGIYKIPELADGGAGAPVLFAGGATPGDMIVPDGLAFDAAGNLFVTDAAGAVYKIPRRAISPRRPGRPTRFSPRSRCLPRRRRPRDVPARSARHRRRRDQRLRCERQGRAPEDRHRRRGRRARLLRS